MLSPGSLRRLVSSRLTHTATATTTQGLTTPWAGINNHLTAAIPGTINRFLVFPFGLLWSEVTASSLLVVDAEGKVVRGTGEPEATAFYIHAVNSCRRHRCSVEDISAIDAVHAYHLHYFTKWRYLICVLCSACI